ncbi:MAG: hypothetical protein IJS81_02375 [Selenomonadaceae bacterium]|nr:hypothetical protein [Selenomonadaceae bacterium]
MSSQIFQINNANAVYIPKFAMQALSLNLKDTVTLEVRNNEEIVIRKSQTKSNYPSIAELFADYSGNEKAQEFSGDRVGRELI